MSESIPKKCWKCKGPLVLRTRGPLVDLYCEKCQRVRKYLKGNILQWKRRGGAVRGSEKDINESRLDCRSRC